MIREIKVTNNLGKELSFDLFHPEVTGFYIKSITGLNPPKANIETESLLTDGSIVVNRRVDKRNIVITFILDHPSKSVEELRNVLYRYFTLKTKVKLTIKTDKKVVYTTGFVESNEINMFTSNKEESQVSIICDSPYLYDSSKGGMIETNFSFIEDALEFPCSNESLTEKLMESGIIHNNQRYNLVYNGEVDTGFIVKFHILGPIGDIEFIDTDDYQYIKILQERITKITGEPFKKSDDVIVDTIIGEKSVKLVRDTKVYNIFNALDMSSTWLQLHPGDNIFAYRTDKNNENISATVYNSIVYWGV